MITGSSLAGLTTNKRKAMIPAHGSASRIGIIKVDCHDGHEIGSPSGDIFTLSRIVGVPQSGQLQ